MTTSRAEAAARYIADVSEASIRHSTLGAEYAAALRPLHPMTPAERRENLLALAQIVVDEHDWHDRAPTVQLVVSPAIRPHVAFFATGDVTAFGRLLLAVKSCNQRDAEQALDRLVAA